MLNQEIADRQSARVVLIDQMDRVLLLKFYVIPGVPDGGYCWHTPGGSVEQGETLVEAAARELFEEVGLSVDPTALGSQVAETSGYADLGYAKGLFRDVFFYYQITTHQVRIEFQEEYERKYRAGHHWWTLDELASSSETISV